MSPESGNILVEQIMPIIAGVIAGGGVRGVGAEDCRELTQDALAIAARLIESAEARGKPVYPGSMAYYALQMLRTGRRSTSLSSVDAMSSRLRLQGGAVLESMDRYPEDGGGEDRPSLHDLLAGPEEDPATIACRKADWDELLEEAGTGRRNLVRSLAEGYSGRETARKLGVSGPRIVQLKKSLARVIRQRWGDGILNEIGGGPSWTSGLVAERQKRACRHGVKGT